MLIGLIRVGLVTQQYISGVEVPEMGGNLQKRPSVVSAGIRIHRLLANHIFLDRKDKGHCEGDGTNRIQ